MARRSSAITSAFLLPWRRSLVTAFLGFAALAFFAPWRAGVGFVAALAALFDLLRGVVPLAWASGCSAAQTRATTFLAGPSLLTGLWPGMLFQTSIQRLPGQLAASCASSAWELKRGRAAEFLAAASGVS